ncbi:UPF0182 family protein [Nesterenkonia pannonica]|uniref:UPF0182 family protein n=1 Tax=Nesterenkonia pannonica TaxID=1548602 RepID=UPI002164780A|nr:UPF0182 family protein [Nesterenkonia pannonica]
MWFSQLGYQEVFWTERIARVAVFAAAFLIMAVLVWLSLFIAFKYRPDGVRQVSESVAQYQRSLTSMRRLLMFGLPALMGVFAAPQPRPTGTGSCCSSTSSPSARLTRSSAWTTASTSSRFPS